MHFIGVTGCHFPLHPRRIHGDGGGGAEVVVGVAGADFAFHGADLVEVVLAGEDGGPDDSGEVAGRAFCYAA